jgi:hypothetical protein
MVLVVVRIRLGLLHFNLPSNRLLFVNVRWGMCIHVKRNLELEA